MSINVLSERGEIVIRAVGRGSAMAMMNIFISAKFLPDEPSADRLFSVPINDVLKCAVSIALPGPEITGYIISYRSSEYWEKVRSIVISHSKEEGDSAEALWQRAIFPASDADWPFEGA